MSLCTKHPIGVCLPFWEEERLPGPLFLCKSTRNRYPRFKHLGGCMKRDFASLSTQEALHVAIFIEERNAEIYHQFAEMFAEFRDPESLEIAAAFWDMATEERKHGTM